MKLGTIVCALRDLDPQGARVTKGDVGVVVEEAHDEYGPRVRWLMAIRPEEEVVEFQLGTKVRWALPDLMESGPLKVMSAGTCNISPQSVEIIGKCDEFDPTQFDP